MQIPSNMIMSKAQFKPSYYMAICMMVWAIVSASTAAVHNYTGLLVVRLFLGKVSSRVLLEASSSLPYRRGTDGNRYH